MGCQTRDYTSSDGFLPIFYLGESIKSSVCSIDNQFRSLVGGKKNKKKRSKRMKDRTDKKSRKYKHYTNGKSRKKYNLQQK